LNILAYYKPEKEQQQRSFW